MENKVRLIDSNRLVKCLKNKRLHILNENENNGAIVFDDIIDLIEYEPEIYVVQKEADVAPVVHGKWEQKEERGMLITNKCSICGQILTTMVGEKKNYCPNCGAKMDLEEREND